MQLLGGRRGQGDRGSLSLDLREPTAAARAATLAVDADVVFEAFRPGVVERLGLGYDTLATSNPRLVYASVSAFGRDGPLSHLKGYEGTVLAKIGGCDQFTVLVDKIRTRLSLSPHCSWSAAELAIHGILTGLFERTRSGVGQRVDTTLVQAIAAHDVFNWMVRLIAKRYAGAFTEVPPVDPRTQVPNSWMSYALMIGLSADGRWLQFSQATPKLFQAFLRAVDLAGPEWKGVWEDEDLTRRAAFRDKALSAIRARTLAEWQEVFDDDPDVFAEIFRDGREVFLHPQLLHDRRIVEVTDAVRGVVRQVAPLVTLSATPGRADRPVPERDAGDDRAPRWRQPPADTASPADTPGRADAAGELGRGLPLDGVTILELGTFFAGPFGATLLTDLGARVIKIEQLDGDPIRWQLPIPEVGAVKVLLGKESVAIDINRAEGQELVRKIATHCDIVLVTFRAGVAARGRSHDEATLRASCPDVIYHAASGFGTDGPYAAPPRVRADDRSRLGNGPPQRGLVGTRTCRSHPRRGKDRRKPPRCRQPHHGPRGRVLGDRRGDRTPARAPGPRSGTWRSIGSHNDALDHDPRALR